MFPRGERDGSIEILKESHRAWTQCVSIGSASSLRDPFPAHWSLCPLPPREEKERKRERQREERKKDKERDKREKERQSEKRETFSLGDKLFDPDAQNTISASVERHLIRGICV